MKTIVVTDLALRELVRELLDNSAPYVPDAEKNAVNVNNVVDKQAAETDPMNPRFMPQDQIELNNAIKVAVRDVPQDKISSVYTAVKGAVKDANSDKKQTPGETQMKTDNKVEEMIRLEVRRILSEIKVDPADVAADEEEAGEAERQKRRGKYKPSSTDFDADVPFADVAKEMGMSVAGAKQAVDKAMMKVQFMASLERDDAEILVISELDDYIDFLTSSGELTSADVQLLKDHPQLATELDGFREFLHDYISQARKEEDPTDWTEDSTDRERVMRAGGKRVVRGGEEGEPQV